MLLLCLRPIMSMHWCQWMMTQLPARNEGINFLSKKLSRCLATTPITIISTVRPHSSLVAAYLAVKEHQFSMTQRTQTKSQMKTLKISF